MDHVIIGNGVAGINAAESIRRLDSAGRITMISNESGLPYSRPMISLVLEGAIDPDKLPVRGPDFYDTLKIDPVLGETVEKLDVEKRTVSTRSGKVFSYDRLLIASGADPRPIEAHGLDLDNIFFMRSQKDVGEMLDILPGAEKALVLGGGLVGFKAAYGGFR